MYASVKYISLGSYHVFCYYQYFWNIDRIETLYCDIHILFYYAPDDHKNVNLNVTTKPVSSNNKWSVRIYYIDLIIAIYM